jgi:hypothetical protein
MNQMAQFLIDQYDLDEMDSETIDQYMQFIIDQYDFDDTDLEKTLIKLSKINQKDLYTLKEISNLKNGL